MCLNEIINAPLEFTSSNPHLVVQYVDWIQCRYLFVKVTQTSDASNAAGTVSTELPVSFPIMFVPSKICKRVHTEFI
jgi:hypothetical protein